jgi:hypothetical protein
MEFNKKTYETVISGLTKKISESEEILKTYNHDIFKKMRGNREINERHVAKLKKSILENYIPNAIIVNENMEIVDGQHRLQALSELGKPVYYRIIKNLNLDSVQRMNTNSRQWTMTDYMNSFCQQNNKEYELVKGFVKITKLSMDICLAMLLNKPYRSSQDRINFICGNFKIKDFDVAVQQAKQLQQIGKYFKHYKDYAFCIAMLSFFHNKDYDHKVFLRKLELQPTALKKQKEKEQYKREVESIYNFRTPNLHKIRFTY